MSNCTKVIRTSMSKELNVILIGPHGVGKTQMVREEVQRQGLKLKYYSSPTMDPWSDLVGIPIPVDAQTSNKVTGKQLQFIRPADIQNAEIVFFDELNRGHPKVGCSTGSYSIPHLKRRTAAAAENGLGSY